MTILSLWRAAPAALFLLLFTACSGGGETDSGEGSNEPVEDSAAAGDSEPEGSAAVDASASDAPSKIDIEATRETARTAMFIPAPSEFQAALNASDVQIDIRKLMVDSDRDLSGKSRSIVALETGVANVADPLGGAP